MRRTSQAGRRPRWISHTAGALLALTILALVGLVLVLSTGHRALVVMSGSMSPTLRTGDIAITEMVSPAEINIGDVVTFRDPGRDQKLVTHRVVRMIQQGQTFSFITKGDVNTGTETWSLSVGGSLGRLKFAVPRAGYATVWAGDPMIRAALFMAAGLLIGVSVLRRIWRG